MARVLASEPGLTEAGTLEKTRGGGARRLTRELQGVSRGLWPADPDLGTIGSCQRGSVLGPPGSRAGVCISISGAPYEFTNLLA